MEYMTMIVLPRENLCTPPKWEDMSLYEHYILLAMRAQESDPIYAREM